MLECVINVSEGTDLEVLDALSTAAGGALLDRHADAGHNRAVFTLAGELVEVAARRLTRAAVSRLDLRRHHGAHPRMGVVDVVPFVPLAPSGAPDLGDAGLARALEARHRFAAWAAEELDLPCFCYGPERSLPEVRRGAFVDFLPDTGPLLPHPTAGACAVGARPVLVAYNLWLDTPDVAVARSLASRVRQPGLRTLGLEVSGSAQVSCNLVEPLRLGPAQAYAAVAGAAADEGVGVARAELVGLAPRAVVDAVAPEDRAVLGLDLQRTIEARLEAVRSG